MPTDTRPETLIIPGLAGSPEGHWQAVWTEDRPESRFVEQKNWDRPDRELWKAELERALAQGDGAYLVAHSLGCLLVASMADSPLRAKIRGALLVAPCDLDRTESLHPGLIRFGGMPEGPLPFPTVLIASRNDPYMAEDRARHFADRWKSRFVDMGYVGHINRASGFGRFPRAYQIFEELVAGTTPRHAGKAPATAAYLQEAARDGNRPAR
jgi:predicted alpha/beta hydrolase family esterase